ncbi:hypothetical protein [Streptomyces sp. NBC_00385]|uniref:hypothetical protein n=1 Tax=Streptomyces sp. NBC_00385 TaxID=2975733 RepID=UPI002DDC2B16|nr:hypothetical protein [Streptomyces sp. NBC_00385]WRZ07879.1 hypothetical protein OG959_33355 [Streptomyces sp. NBC_00385]
MNAQLDAAHAAVPDIAEHFVRKQRVEELLSTLPAVDAPEIEAQRVADEAVAEYIVSGAWPADVEERAQAAYARAVGAHAVRAKLLAMNRTYVDGSTLRGLREAFRTEILAALGTQLADLLAEAEKHVGALGATRTADEALTAGGATAEAYTKLRPLVAVLAGIREAQWSALSQGEITGPTSLHARAKVSGHGDVQGINDDTPAHQIDVMKSQAYDLDHLVWITQMGTAYIPESVDDVMAAQDAFDGRHSVSDGVRPVDISPMVVPNRPVAQPANPRSTYESERVAKSRAQRSY